MLVTIGTYKQDREQVRRCPSYYAADWEELELTPGEYPVELEFVNGYTVPMPYWLHVFVPSIRIAGALYSGFCGNNFASRELQAGEAVTYGIQTYSYCLKDMVAKGIVTLKPGFEWLLEDVAWQSEKAPKTWQEVVALKAS